MQLFQIPFSHNCVKVRRALDLKGLAYETIDINPARRGNVKRASGQELVPVLVEHGRPTAGSTPILLEVERRHRRDARMDGDALDASEQEHRPCQVDEPGGDEPCAERDRRHCALGGEAHGEMADEHQPPSSAFFRSSCTGLSPSQMRSSAR